MADVGEVEEQWSDAHDTVEDGPSTACHPMGIDQMSGVGRSHDSTFKISSDEQKPVLDSALPSGGESMSSNAERASDTASVHSMPIVHVTEAQSPLIRRPTSGLAESPSSTPSALPTRPHSSTADSSPPAQDRRDRHRSAIEVRSPSRLSGFFTNFMNRREPGPNPPSTPASPPRPSSPARVTTPPPQLPPPTLQELGLALSVVTSDLSPSHFSAPPWSGTFLEPHYLLLCHAQGLDVLPLVSPPFQQPYALVRRVCFKSVVVMEQRGVLVAIAGRRDGVRVYALEDVKKFVEWRMDFEVRRERERMRREAAKKVSPSSLMNNSKLHNPPDKKTKSRLSNPSSGVAKRLGCKSSHSAIPSAVPPVPKAPSLKKVKSSVAPAIPEPSGRPPPYIGRQSSDSPGISCQTRNRSPSVNDVLAGASSTRPQTGSDSLLISDTKADWQEGSSDDEAINIVAAGVSGSQALDERTSAILPSTPSTSPAVPLEARPSLSHHQSSSTLRRNRPANLDLSLSRTSTAVVAAPPSPTPTLMTLRQALSQFPGSVLGQGRTPDTPPADVEDDDEEDGGISLVQALLESRLPDLPPVGSRCPQQPILFTVEDNILASPRTSDAVSHHSGHRSPDRPERRRRRWSVLDGVLSNGPSTRQSFSQAPLVPSGQSSVAGMIPTGRRLFRSHSGRSLNSPSPAASTQALLMGDPQVTPLATAMPSLVTPSRSRFLPRIFSNALRSEEHSKIVSLKSTESDGPKSGAALSQPTPPKLEYVKLPGTKGSLLIKAVETAKKSFLAILCGENGEKVELFAGTYRTALGLSRTFILPDSPRSLELQLQGDDLVEIFLVFSQNVFGLEPATVRVREVRIGRAERRAARRRARELRTGESVNDLEGPLLGDEDPSVNVNIGVTVSVGSNVVATGEGEPTTPLPSPPIDDSTSGDHFGTSLAHAEELVSLATAQAGPYTTFQQLSFAPKFPLASIADDYIIPPTYPEFLQYRAEHEPEVNGSGNADLARIQFSPPGLPLPANTPPSKWFYRDPKGIVHGPWKASLMQAWYKDGLLPPDLPVKKEGETEFVLLKDLRLQSVDPTYPFRSPPPPPTPEVAFMQDSAKPLLQPISLLSQPKHFGPPALFFSSRGGHNTTIVDARGKSVLKGRFLWSDEHDDDSNSQAVGRMGDVKRLETFNIKDRAVLVAMRRGGLEAVDMGDALLRPADESRTMLPQFCPPPSNTNRRSPFVWKIGTPVFSSPTSSTILSSKSKGSHILPGKKHSTSSARTPARMEFSIDGDETHDEVLFLGRNNDDIYMCERNAGTFRILRLCPS